MKRKATLFATLLTGLLVASAVQASPFMLFDQLFGMGAPDVTTQGVGPFGPGEGGWGPCLSPPCGKAGPSDATAADVTAQGNGPHAGRGEPSYGYGPYGYKCTLPPCGQAGPN